MNCDEAFRAVGEFGRHQRLVFIGLAMIGVVSMMQMVQIVFVGAVPNFTCYNKGVLIAVNSTCEDKCDVLEFNSGFTSIVSEWNLVCNLAYKASMVQSIFMVGVLIGAFLFGIIADRFGRKITLFYALAAMAFSSLAGAWCMDLTSFIAVRFITGFHNSGVIVCAYVLNMELIGTSWRMICGAALQVAASLGVILIAWLAYTWPQWRSLVFVMSIMVLPTLLLYKLIPESPRWLVARDRIHEAELAFDRIAQKNGVTCKKIVLTESVATGSKSDNSGWDLVRNDILCRYTFILFYVWFVISCVYYGLTTSAGQLGANMYTSVSLSGLVEIPANMAVILLLSVLGRRTSICSFMIIGGASCLLIIVVCADCSKTITAFAMIGKLSITASFNIIYIWSAEIFPTYLRGAGMGMMSVGARTGGLVSPLIVILGNISFPIPYLVYGALSLSAGFFLLALPETRGQRLPETTDDLLSLGGHFVDTDNDKTWSAELLLDERLPGLRSKQDKVWKDRSRNAKLT